MKKKIIVIGGGIAGLNAGIELLQNGYEVALYEKNEDVGGLCSGYFVDGYSIDACFHWLMGTKANTTLNKLWRNIDALNDDVPISHLPYFCSFIYEETTVTFSRNLDEEEARWKALSKEDEEVITEFFESVRGLASLWILTQSEGHPPLSKKLFQTLPNPAKVLKTMKMSRKDYADRFKHPALRFALTNAMTGYNNAFFFLQVYGLFSTGDGDVPLGGAYELVRRIKNRYLSLGGELHCNVTIDKLVYEGLNVSYALSGNKKISGDYFIAALDVNYTLNHLLGGEFKSITYSRLNKHIENYTISSCFCVYLKVKDFANDIETPTCCKVAPLHVGVKDVDALLVRPYAFDTLMSKEDAAVVSLFIDQDQDDYAFFKNHQDVIGEEKRIVDDLVNAFLTRYPQYQGKVEVLDFFGPLELASQTNTSYGSIQSYSFTDKGSFYAYKGKSYILENLYMCGQWNRSIGGTPTALLTSHETVGKLLRREQRLALLPNRVLIDHA